MPGQRVDPMNRLNIRARNAGLAVCTAMAAALLVSCAGQMPLAATGATAVSGDAEAGRSADRDLARAEQRVARSRRDGSARAALAQAYLSAGRFDSAATTFEDAVSLGDQSPRTGLGTALAYIGAGRSAEATAVLARLHDRIPASDYGLAISLAGQPAEGVAVLTDVVRGGENTPKARQNLAYAYALDGRWREARLIASQDVPADQLDARLGQWAAAARPDQSRARIAGLIGAPLRSDPGQPAMLALDTPAGNVQMARVEAPEPAPAAPTGELPPVQTGESFWGTSRTAEAAPAPVAMPAAPVRMAAANPAPVRKAAPARKPQTVSSTQATHLVQLGSFRTMDGARRAWGIIQSRNPALKGHGLRITEAKVNGQTYYRVAAEGFDQRAAQSVCSSVRQGGNPCLAYAQQRPLPGGVGTNQMRRAEL
ncbi:sporulation related protein [Novosphingobium sp. ST904]|nr:sporulation related protein [Novosphingobium sp. ST904]